MKVKCSQIGKQHAKDSEDRMLHGNAKEVEEDQFGCGNENMRQSSQQTWGKWDNR
jgi:hypothetical protein